MYCNTDIWHVRALEGEKDIFRIYESSRHYFIHKHKHEVSAIGIQYIQTKAPDEFGFPASIPQTESITQRTKPTELYLHSKTIHLPNKANSRIQIHKVTNKLPCTHRTSKPPNKRFHQTNATNKPPNSLLTASDCGMQQNPFRVPEPNFRSVTERSPLDQRSNSFWGPLPERLEPRKT